MPNLHVHSFTRMKNVQTICSETPYTAFNTLLKIESIYGDFALQTAFSTLGDNVKKIFKVSRILATGKKKDKHFPF